MSLIPPYLRVMKLLITMRRKKNMSKLSIKSKLSPQYIQVCPMTRK
jgi:hypothetical protein